MIGDSQMTSRKKRKSDTFFGLKGRLSKNKKKAQNFGQLTYEPKI